MKNTPQSSTFIPAQRLSDQKSDDMLKQLSLQAILEADKCRLASIDGDTPCIRKHITQQHKVAACAETEIILRSIFKY